MPEEDEIKKNNIELRLLELSSRVQKLEIRVARLESMLKVMLSFIIPIFILILGSLIKDPTLHIGPRFFIALSFITLVFLLIVTRKNV